jgi:hypothetical protein
MNNKFPIIETDQYWLAVSDEEIKRGEYYFNLKNNEIFKLDGVVFNHRKKIIAYQPKDDTKELDLPLLPEMVIEDDVEKLADEYTSGNRLFGWWAFVRGYKAATKVYSEDDLRKVQQAILCNQKDAVMNENYAVDFIQSLKQPETPKWFVAEMEQENLGEVFNGHSLNIIWSDPKLKTTTINGKTYLVGTYLYE